MDHATLCIACHQGRVDVVLLETGECDTDKAGLFSRLASFYISYHQGRVVIVRLLVEAGECVTNNAMNYGRTPF